MAVFDDFNRADGGLGSNWTAQTPLNPPLIFSNEAIGDGSGIQAAYYSATNFTDSHASSCIFNGTTANFAAPTVRAQSSDNSWYGYFNNGTVQKCIAGTRTTIATFATYAVGERAKLSVVGTTLEAFIDGVSQGTVVDSDLTGGYAGIAFVGGVFDATVDDWEGDGETLIRGSFIFGAFGRLTSTLSGLINLDGVTRTVNGPRTLHIWADDIKFNGVSMVSGSGTGDVEGPASAVDGEVALYDGTTGKLLKRATGTGVAKLTSGVLSVSDVDLASEVTGDLPVTHLDGGTGASGTTFWRGDGSWATPVGGGGGGATTTDPYASRPAAGNDGDLFFPTDSLYIERDNGSVWQSWAPVFAVTRPVDGDFSWVNQGSATVDASKGSISLIAPPNSAIGWRVRAKAAPSTPYVITAWFIPVVLNVGVHRIAILFRQSSDGKLVTAEFSVDVVGDEAKFVVNKWTNPTTFSAQYSTINAFSAGSSPICLRIADNGTNRIVSYSPDGQNFFQLHTVGRTDFLTADQVGFGADPNNATFGCGMNLLSWQET